MRSALDMTGLKTLKEDLPDTGRYVRARSKTLSTPVGTPTEQRSEFISSAMLQLMLGQGCTGWSRLPIELKTHVMSFLSATDKIRCMQVRISYFTDTMS